MNSERPLPFAGVDILEGFKTSAFRVTDTHVGCCMIDRHKPADFYGKRRNAFMDHIEAWASPTNLCVGGVHGDTVNKQQDAYDTLITFGEHVRINGHPISGVYQSMDMGDRIVYTRVPGDRGLKRRDTRVVYSPRLGALVKDSFALHIEPWLLEHYATVQPTRKALALVNAMRFTCRAYFYDPRWRALMLRLMTETGPLTLNIATRYSPRRVTQSSMVVPAYNPMYKTTLNQRATLVTSPVELIEHLESMLQIGFTTARHFAPVIYLRPYSRVTQNDACIPAVTVPARSVDYSPDEWVRQRLWSWLADVMREWELAGWGFDGQNHTLSKAVDTAYKAFSVEKPAGLPRLQKRLRRLHQLLSKERSAYPLYILIANHE